jgi:hypothetical protein
MRLKPLRSGILKEAYELRKRLEPRSALHLQMGRRDCVDLDPLRIAVTQTRNLSERLSDPKFPAVELECAWNGIMPSKLRK